MRFITIRPLLISKTDICAMKTLFFIPILLLSLLACKSSTPKEAVPEPATAIQGIADSLHGRMDTTIHAEPIAEKKETSKPHITDRICNPNFTLLAKQANNKQIFYVSGFNHEEFKCWEEIQYHAVKVCGDHPGVVYYVDLADIKVIPAATDLLDPAVLKEHGIGKFVYDGKYWNLNGASIWKRSGNGWSYYTTNNQFGG
jgi:hypothetical protein